MLEHWIQPSENSEIFKNYLTEDRIGSNLSVLSDRPANPGTRQIALLGVDSRWSKAVRRHLFRFTFRMSETNIYDLGDLRRSDPDFVIGPLLELLSSNICPILIGGQPGLLKALQQAHLQLRKRFHPTVLCETLPDIPAEYIQNSSVLGVQQHLLGRNIPDGLSMMHLSTVRNMIAEAETLIRESNGIVADLSAISYHDVPAQFGLSSSGLSTEEACMLMRYSGLHSDSGFVMISGHDPRSLELDISANTTAQMLWYFIEAYNQAIHEDPARSKHCTSYTVHLDSYDTGFVFYKSEHTGRWWVKLQTESTARVYPCTYRDYVNATNGQVSDRLIACANASLKHSKHAF